MTFYSDKVEQCVPEEGRGRSGRRKELQRGRRKCLWMMEKFTILIVAMISQVCAYVKIPNCTL